MKCVQSHFCPTFVPFSLSPRLSHRPLCPSQNTKLLNHPCSQDSCVEHFLPHGLHSWAANSPKQSEQLQNCSTGSMWLLLFVALNSRNERSHSKFFRKEFLLSPRKGKLDPGAHFARFSLPHGHIWHSCGEAMPELLGSETPSAAAQALPGTLHPANPCQPSPNTADN